MLTLLLPTYLDLLAGALALKEGLDEVKVCPHELERHVELLRVLLGPPIRRVSLLVVE